METVKSGVLSLFDAMIEAAPSVDTSTRCSGIFGEPNFPREEDCE